MDATNPSTVPLEPERGQRPNGQRAGALFDELARIAAQPLPRREVLRLTLWALAGGVLFALWPARAAADCASDPCAEGQTCCPSPDGTSGCCSAPNDLCCEGFCIDPSHFLCCAGLGHGCDLSQPQCCGAACCSTDQQCCSGGSVTGPFCCDLFFGACTNFPQPGCCSPLEVCVDPTGGVVICCPQAPSACMLFCPPSSVAAVPAVFAIAHNFSGSPTDGASPLAGLIQGRDGTLYGTTNKGGSANLGTVFQIVPAGSGFTILHHFTGSPTDGANPNASLIQGPDGTLYGTTHAGGSAGLGTVFQMASDGTFTILHHFTGGAIDGASPNASLIQGPDGTLYGTTRAGGSANLGTVFQIVPAGSGFTILHHFTGGTSTSGTTDGANPYARLIQAPDGTLYGTTVVGGSAGLGTVFQMAPDGSGFAILHNFTGGSTDGASPYASLIQASDGTLYGTTRAGGSANLGTVFQTAPDGSLFTILHNFMGNLMTDGAYPYAELVQGTDGTLYGTTVNGGASRVVGTIFQMAPDGSGYSILHIFDVSPSDGALPIGGLIQGADGTLYGTTSRGGANGNGVVFRL
jgi:uncharacterized repeat protein (TIGR03803 family)